MRFKTVAFQLGGPTVKNSVLLELASHEALLEFMELTKDMQADVYLDVRRYSLPPRCALCQAPLVNMYEGLEGEDWFCQVCPPMEVPDSAEYDLPMTTRAHHKAVQDIMDGNVVMPTVLESDVCVSMTDVEGDPPLMMIRAIFPCPECGAIKGETCKPTCMKKQYP